MNEPERVLVRGNEGEPLACSCKKCGRFTLDTKTELCTTCGWVDAIPKIMGLNNI